VTMSMTMTVNILL